MRFHRAREKERNRSTKCLTSLFVSSMPNLTRLYSRRNVWSTSHRIRIADKNRCSVHNAVYMCYHAFHINYEGSKRPSRKRADSAAYTYTHIYIQSRVYIYAYSFCRIFCERRYNRAVCRNGTKKERESSKKNEKKKEETDIKMPMYDESTSIDSTAYLVWANIQFFACILFKHIAVVS